MGEKRGGLVWLWVLIGIGAVAGVGYGWYKYTQPETGEELVTVEVSVSEEGVRVEPGKEGRVKDASGKPGDALDTAGKPIKGGDVPGAGTGEKDTILKPKPTGEMVEYQFKSREKRMSRKA